MNRRENELIFERYKKHLSEADVNWQQGVRNVMGAPNAMTDRAWEKAREYADRILKGEPKETILQGQGPLFIQKVDQLLQQAQPQQQQAQPQQQQAQPQLSMQAVEDWILNTLNAPALVDVWERAVQQQNQQIFSTVQKAMNGDQIATQSLLNMVQAQKV